MVGGGSQVAVKAWASPRERGRALLASLPEPLRVSALRVTIPDVKQGVATPPRLQAARLRCETASG